MVASAGEWFGGGRNGGVVASEWFGALCCFNHLPKPEVKQSVDVEATGVDR